jgi:hypothetical protein
VIPSNRGPNGRKVKRLNVTSTQQNARETSVDLRGRCDVLAFPAIWGTVIPIPASMVELNQAFLYPDAQIIVRHHRHPDV